MQMVNIVAQDAMCSGLFILIVQLLLGFPVKAALLSKISPKMSLEFS